MAKRWKEVVCLTLEGPGFADGAIGLPALQAVLDYQEIITETAEHLWRAENPQAGRLPDNFKQMTILRLREIGGGSARLSLEAQLEEPAESGFPHLDAERPPEPVEKAVQVVSAAIEHAQNDQPPPEDLPRDVIPLIGQWGKGLGADEAIGILAPGRPKVMYSGRERARILELQEGKYEDDIDLVGTVLAADVKKRHFIIYRNPQDRKGVEVKKFEPEQEATIIDALKEHETRRLRIIGRGVFERPGGALLAVPVVQQIIPLATGEIPVAPDARPIWRELVELADEVPEMELEKLPHDMARNVDHYLYGGEKK